MPSSSSSSSSSLWDKINYQSPNSVPFCLSDEKRADCTIFANLPVYEHHDDRTLLRDDYSDVAIVFDDSRHRSYRPVHQLLHLPNDILETNNTKILRTVRLAIMPRRFRRIRTILPWHNQVMQEQQIPTRIVLSVMTNPSIEFFHLTIALDDSVDDVQEGIDLDNDKLDLIDLCATTKTITTLSIQARRVLDPFKTTNLANSILRMENLLELGIVLDDENEDHSLLRAIFPQVGLALLNLQDFKYNVPHSLVPLDVITAIQLCEGLTQSDSIRHVDLDLPALDSDAMVVLSTHLPSLVHDVTIRRFGGHHELLASLIAGPTTATTTTTNPNQEQANKIFSIGSHRYRPFDGDKRLLDDSTVQAVADGLLRNKTLVSLSLYGYKDAFSQPNFTPLVTAATSVGFTNLQNLRLGCGHPTKMTDNNCSALCTLIRSHRCPLLSFLGLEFQMKRTHYESILAAVTDSPGMIKSFQLLVMFSRSAEGFPPNFRFGGVQEQDDFTIYVENNQHLMHLSEKLPQMSKLLHLELGELGHQPSVELQNSLLDGMKQNKSIIHIELPTDVPVNWPKQFTQRLQSYCKRNMIVKAAFALSIGRLPPQVMIKAVETILQKKALAVSTTTKEMHESHSATLLFNCLRGPQGPLLWKSWKKSWTSNTTTEGMIDPAFFLDYSGRVYASLD